MSLEKNSIGRKLWPTAEGYIPSYSYGHVKFNDLKDPEPIPKGTDYACVIELDQPIVVQHTRLDSRQAENALLSTIPSAAD